MKENPAILIVEDDPNDRFLIRRALGRAGIASRRYFVESGEKAISYLSGTGEFADRRKYPLPAVLLLDLKLPGLSGFEVLEWIRGGSRFSSLRLVVLTNSDEIRDVNKAYRLGADSFLVKPLEFENVSALFETISTQIWKANNHDALEKASRTNATPNWNFDAMPHGQD